MYHRQAIRSVIYGLVGFSLQLGPRPIVAELQTSKKNAPTDVVDRAIDGVIARASAIYSILVEYQYRSGPTDGSPEGREQLELVFAREGENWLLRHQNSANFRMNHRDASLNYYEAHDDETQRLDRSLHVQAAQALRDFMVENAGHAVSRLGTFWFEPQADFVDSHRRDARRLPDQTVEGYSTMVLEWQVDHRTFDQAMILIPMAIAKAKRGRLRVYTCEQLNWAMPRIEYLSPSGNVERRFSASKFEDLGDGIYFPRRAWAEQSPNGASKNRCDFDVQTISHTNQSLPKNTFKIDVPVSTRVRDSRPGKATTVFSLRDENQVNGLNWALNQGTPADRRSGWRPILIVGNVLLVAALIGWLRMRRRKS